MGSILSVKKNNVTRQYVGGELIYIDKAKTKQVKEIYVKKNSVSKLVWQYDITAPTLIINQSTSAINYNNTGSYTISGSVTDTESGVKSITVDGVIITISSGNWSKVISLSKGKQVHSIIATDNAGNSSSAQVTTYYDSTAPTLTYSPTANPYLSYDNVTVTASAIDTESGLKSLTIGGQSANSRIYTPSTTKETITIVATDYAGNSTTKYAYIQKPSVPSGFSLTASGWVTCSGDGSSDTKSTTGSTSVNTAQANKTTYGFQHSTYVSCGGQMRIIQGYTKFTANFYSYFTRDTDDTSSSTPFLYQDNALTVEVYNYNGSKVATLGTANCQVRGTATVSVNVSAYNNGLYFLKVYAGCHASGYSWCGAGASLSMKLS